MQTGTRQLRAAGVAVQWDLHGEVEVSVVCGVICGLPVRSNFLFLGVSAFVLVRNRCHGSL